MTQFRLRPHLFGGTSFDFEHTLPLSDSFDNSLTNLTICETHYNRVIKKDQYPTQLKNYEQEWNGYSAIKSRLKLWIDKVAHLKNLIDDNKLRTKKTQDIETKNYFIKERHLLQFDLDYWDKKVRTFTLTVLPNWWKNSQLVDTQIISKYARAYLKSLFPKVDVQKGSVTAEFRKIYGIMGDEKKDRSKHSHHAKDAAVLTLIPGSAKREDILKKHYEAKKHKQQSENILPYSEFHISHIIDIEEGVLINHISKDQTLTKAIKKVRKRGKIAFVKDKNTQQYLRDEEGKKTPMIMQGDSIRGQLHKETYFGAIKVPERNENGFAYKKDGKYAIKQKNNQDELWIVVRKTIESINIDKDVIVDDLLKKYIKQQLDGGKKIHEVVDFNNNPIRHVRCRVAAGRGYLTPEKAIELRTHSHPSIHLHKKYVLAQNEENYIYLLYEKYINSKQTARAGRIISLFDFHSLGFTNANEIWTDIAFNQMKLKEVSLPLKHILKTGQRVIFYIESKEELGSLDGKELRNRTFTIYKFNEMGTPNIFLQNHIEARPDKDLDDGDTAFSPNKYQYRLKLKADKMSCVVENIDFNIRPDGEIVWLF